MDLKLLRTDATKESEGVWVPLDAESAIKVRSSDTQAYARANRKKFEPYRNAMRPGRRMADVIPDESMNKIALDLIVDEILVDWKGIKDGDAEVPYSKDAAREFLKIKPFRDMVEAAAADLTNFRAEAAREDAKN